MISTAEAFRIPASTSFITWILTKGTLDYGVILNVIVSTIVQIGGMALGGVSYPKIKKMIDQKILFTVAFFYIGMIYAMIAFFGFMTSKIAYEHGLFAEMYFIYGIASSFFTAGLGLMILEYTKQEYLSRTNAIYSALGEAVVPLVSTLIEKKKDTYKRFLSYQGKRIIKMLQVEEQLDSPVRKLSLGQKMKPEAIYGSTVKKDNYLYSLAGNSKLSDKLSIRQIGRYSGHMEYFGDIFILRSIRCIMESWLITL